MRDPVRAKELLGACFVLFAALLVWPLLSIPNRPVLVAGLPALVLYLFAVWGLLWRCSGWLPARLPATTRHHFLEASARRSKKPVRDIAPAAMQALCRYRWPGNVRELENVIERAVIVARGDAIGDVERFLGPESGRPGVDLSLPFRDAKAKVVEEFERAYISGVLEASGGKLTAAAKHADMDPKNFSEKLVRYGLRRSGTVDSAEDARPRDPDAGTSRRGARGARLRHGEALPRGPDGRCDSRSFSGGGGFGAPRDALPGMGQRRGRLPPPSP